MNKPWTHEELQAMIPALKADLQGKIEQTEAEELANHNSIVRGIPPLTEDECLEYFYRLFATALERTWTYDERMMAEQLLCVYQQAVMARMITKKKGRYFVIPEEKIQELAEGKL